MKARGPRRFPPFSDFELEAYLCDELSADARARVQRALEQDAALQSYIADRQRARAVFAERYPLQRRRRRWPAALSILGAAAIAAASLLLVLQTPAAPPDTVRVKGHSELRAALSVRRGEHVWTYRPEQALRAGDQLMLSLDSDVPGYVTLLGRDARGEIAVYFDGLEAPGGRFVAPSSLTLDAALGEELWLVVLSPQRRAAEEYFEQLARDQPPDVPHAYFRLRKEPP
ncbi:MAG TPA: hypothetical protein VMF89_35425 [Polyangiales bacterium]|nr:hypothetical protein [Polyangiales bacterium]